ncbi:MAG: type I-MYXAN CRISPR-associated protein Cas6/Cmx6 [Gammaproteobacteria bacterium]|nr:type I-MYXAN CRISPR-associated protein Cas6/Cmx6 [Gammaproteobacteria bacterium]MCW8991796.1 type I-MYXAN CRISPR-associated protein Cas6/Cmx6 [Gammaproteobacteria bacterium]
MFWQEENDDDTTRFVVPDDVVDIQFSINCKSLPVDHAHALSSAIREVLPWFEQEEQAGLHLIHVADSGNGWERPEGEGEILYLSRRTKLTLRVPQQRVEPSKALSGRKLEVAGHDMEVGKASVRLLSTTTALYARYVVVPDPQQSENEFLATVVDELRQSGARFKKVLCGKENTLSTPTGPLVTRSLMVADLSLDDAIRLQEIGVGHHRYKKMGCGLFIPHKTV